MRKALYILASVVAVVVLLLVSLVFSHSGNVLLWNQATRHIDALSGELAEGKLLTGLTLKDFAWKNQFLIFNADSVKIDWRLSAILDDELPVNLIDIQNPSLTLKEAPVSDEKEDVSTSDKPFEMPIRIIVDQINIENFEFSSPVASLSLGSLSSNLTFDNKGLSIEEILANQLSIQIPESESSKNPAPKSEPAAIKLPEVQLPFAISLEKLNLTNATYQQGTLNEVIKTLTLSFNAESSEFNDIQLMVDHGMASASLAGNIRLSDDYPLSADIDATIHKPLLDGELENQQLQLHTSGSLSDLQLSLDASGPVNAGLKGSVQPIGQDLPFDFHLSWKKIQWPISSQPAMVSASHGSLIAAGNLKNYKLQLDTGVQVPKQPETSIVLSGEGDLGQLRVKQLRLNSPGGYLDLTGKMKWQNEIRWQGKTQIVNFNPEYWLPQFPGKLNGTIQSDFLWQNSQWHVDVPSLSIQGSLRQLPLSVSGQLSAQQASGDVIPVHANINHLEASIGKNHLTANGSLADLWALQAQIKAPALTEIYPELQGSLNGDIQLTGNAKAPEIDFYLSSPKIMFRQFHLSTLASDGRITLGKTMGGMAHVDVAGFETGEIKLHNLKLAADGNEKHHTLQLSVEGEPVSGQLAVAGSWENQQWNGQLKDALFNTPLDQWKLETPVAIGINKQQQVSLSDQCWLSQDARLCLDQTKLSAQQGNARFQLSKLDLQRLKPFYPQGFDWSAVLSASGYAAWQGNQPEISLQLNTTPGTLSSGELSFDYTQLQTLFNFRQQRLSSVIKFQSSQLGVADIDVAIANIDKDRNLSGNILLEKLRLDFLANFVPQITTLDGILSAKTMLAGTVKKPQAFGELAIEQGMVITESNIVSISDLSTKLKLQGTKGVIDGSMKVGDGTLNLGGHLNLDQQPPEGLITLKGQEIEVHYPGLFEVKVSPDLQFALGKAMELKGKVVIPWARIEVKELPKSAIKVSDDAVVIKDGDPNGEQEQSAPFSINLEIVLGDDIALDAYGLKTNLGGRLYLTQRAGQALGGNGSILLEKGRYRYLGQDLLIKEGKIIFSGPLNNPYLMVNAIRNPDSIQDNVTAGIRVNGSISRPDWEVYSDPAMSQQEQLSYLLRGRGLDNGDDSALQSILLGAGVSQVGGIVTSAGEAVGLSDVTLDTEGSGADTQVTIGGNIAPGLRVQYGAGVFSSIAEIKVRYELMPRLYLQAVSGLAQAVDLFYQFKIDTTKKAEGQAPTVTGSLGQPASSPAPAMEARKN